MLCPESLRVQAYFDGETDAVSAAEIERHVERCPECRELNQSLERTRTALRSELSYHRVPAALRARVLRSLAREPDDSVRATSRLDWGGRPFWAGALSGFGLAAVAAALAMLFLLPLRTSPLLEDILAAHLRSLMSARLIDVTSSDRHTVKPWFAGHVELSPTVADFDQQGYRLLGGRADYLDHQRSAVIVYQHGAHVINVFTWAAGPGSAPHDVTRAGYHLLFWKSADLEYCAVSDSGWDELRSLARLIQDRSASEGAQ